MSGLPVTELRPEVRRSGAAGPAPSPLPAALLGLLLSLFLVAGAWAQINPDDLLPVEEAFALDASVDGTDVVLSWRIADGYYLYRHAFRVDQFNDGLALDELVIPPGEMTTDEFFGETETYRGRVEVRAPVLAVPDDGQIEFRIRSQGCADLGLCYPPHFETVSLQLDPGTLQPTQAEEGLSGLLGRDSTSRSPLTGIDAGALPPEEAFSLQAIATGPASILVRADAQPGYYLYREQFAFRIDRSDLEVAEAVLPAGEAIVDESFGETEVFFGEVEIPVHLARPAGPAQRVDLTIDYQGCREGSICYPPLTRTIEVELPAAEQAVRQAETEPSAPASEVEAAAPPAAEQDRLAAALSGTPMLALLLFLIAGLLLAFTPCVFPMVPILSGLIAGEGDRLTTWRAFRLSLVYVLAMALVYTAFGVVAGLFGQNLQALFQHPVVLSSFAALFVLLSLAMFGFYELQLPSSWQTRLNEMSNRAEGGTLMGAAIMGALSALVVGPCVAPALMGALIYIGQTGDAVLGGAALFSMAMGMGIPLIVWGTSAGKWLPRAGVWMNAVKAVFGVGLLALAIWMLERVIPPAATMLLWGVLAIASAVYLGALTRLPLEVSGWRKLWQAMGVVLLLFGGAQLIGALSGGDDWLRPLDHLRGGAAVAPVEAASFRQIDRLTDLESAIAAAPGPVFLSFTAEWCVDCRRMERRTFPDPIVQQRFAEMTLLKVDVTDYNEDHQEILGHFGLIGPPAYLFFDQGREVSGLRAYGFLTAARLATMLDEVSGS